ncbi:hypothetical protein QYF36_004281 [Acer negundo]|nr:hypothetical protein QYF36_004281 [Acer negundo]
MLQLIEEEDDYEILLGMTVVEGERLVIESRGPRHGGSVPSHAVIDRDRVEDEQGIPQCKSTYDSHSQLPQIKEFREHTPRLFEFIQAQHRIRDRGTHSQL